MATSSFAAVPTVLSPPHLQFDGKSACYFALASLPHPPPPPSRYSAALPSSSCGRGLIESPRFSLLQARATSSEETTGTIDTGEFIADLKEKWDAVENKSTVLIYGGGAIVAVWISSIIVGAINSVPLLPKIMELVGLGYSGWFVYRYLLFKSSRKELATDIEALKRKIAGTAE